MILVQKIKLNSTTYNLSKAIYSDFFLSNLLKNICQNKNYSIFAPENQVKPTKKQRSNVQIQSIYISRIAFCKGEASWFGTFLEQQYNEISKPGVVDFGFLLRNISNSKKFPRNHFFRSYFPLSAISFFANAFFKPKQKKDVAAIGARNFSSK